MAEFYHCGRAAWTLAVAGEGDVIQFVPFKKSEAARSENLMVWEIRQESRHRGVPPLRWITMQSGVRSKSRASGALGCRLTLN